MVTLVTTKVTMLDPVGEVRAEGKDLARRVGRLNGKRIGLLNNGVSRSIDFDRISELITGEFQPAQIIYREKPNHCAPSPKELLDELASKCDLVISGTCA